MPMLRVALGEHLTVRDVPGGEQRRGYRLAAHPNCFCDLNIVLAIGSHEYDLHPHHKFVWKTA